MGKNNTKIYASKDILLGYVTTVNPDSYTIEGQVIKTILPFKIQRINRKEKRIVPLETYFPYYSIETTTPIVNKMSRKSAWITSNEIERIIKQEKTIQHKKNTKTVSSVDIYMDNNKKVTKIENELDIYKTKRYIA